MADREIHFIAGEYFVSPSILTPHEDLFIMANIIVPPRWTIAKHETTPKEVFFHRRAFIKEAGLAALMIGTGLSAITESALGQSEDGAPNSAPVSPPKGANSANGLYPAKRDAAYKLDRELTAQEEAFTHNNFYEFANSANGRDYPQQVHKVAEGYDFRPWEVELTGLCANPAKLSIEEIEKLVPLEERLYRHRCVETWAMAVPWVGYSLSHLLKVAEPRPEAKFVRFTSFLDRTLPGIQKAGWYPWPYYEGLTIDEAMNELTLACTGVYGQELPPQMGAPIRVVVPWKYGYKSIKSIVKIEFMEKQPGTFWHDMQPREYGFESNVNPGVPHPRWSQAQEWMLGGSRRDRRPTQIYNGYGEYVEKLYS